MGSIPDGDSDISLSHARVTEHKIHHLFSLIMKYVIYTLVATKKNTEFT